MKKLRQTFLAVLLVCPFTFISQAHSTSGLMAEKVDKKAGDKMMKTTAIPVPDLKVSFSVDTVPCNGNNITLTVEGGTAPYSYVWSTGETTKDLTSVNPGTYSVKVTDYVGMKTSGSVVVSGDSILTLSSSTNDVTCPGVRDGSAKVIPTGGTAPYTYLWSNGATTQEITKLFGGTFKVTVTDATGCSKTMNISVSAPPRFGFSIDERDPKCFGGNDGYVNVAVTGGSSPYHYLWTTGDTVSYLTNITAGVYTLQITDRRNCKVTTDVYVSSPDSMAVAATGTMTCVGGNVDLQVSGGLEPYTYLWSNGETSSGLQGVPAGNYSVVVTDNNGCSNQPLNVELPAFPEFTFDVIKNDVSCNGLNNGSIAIHVTSAAAPYYFFWSNGMTDSVLTNLAPGSYSGIVTDANGCTHVIGPVTIHEPQPLKLSLSANESETTGGSVDLTVTGGTGSYSYVWSNGATTEDLHDLAPGKYIVTVTDASGCYAVSDTALITGYPLISITSVNALCAGGNTGQASASVTQGTAPYNYVWSNGATTPSIINLTAGTYTITVTDSKGLSKTSSIVITEPTPIALSLTATNVTCAQANNGSITATINGGTSPYQFNWSNGTTTNSITELSPATYTLNITDANGCSNSTSYVITEPLALSLSVAVSGNSIDLSVAGGVGPYTYTWSNGATTQDLTNVPNGTYTVVVRDANNCSSTKSATVNVSLTASIDCCQDTYIKEGQSVTIPIYFTMNGPYVLKYKEIYDHKSSAIKTVTTSSNPYLLTVSPSSTTSYELVSVTANNVTGTVCGRATVGVNHDSGSCAYNCFSGELLSVQTNGTCKTFQVRIKNDGHCRFGLSHVVFSVPCGTITSVSNTRNYAIAYGMDPTTKINGFKIDNVSNFGQAKNGVEESFIVTYTVCTSSTGCGVPSCAPMFGFKAGQCLYYTKATTSSAGRIGDEDFKTEQVESLSVYPNPADHTGSFTLVLPETISNDHLNVALTDQYGKLFQVSYEKTSTSNEVQIMTSGIPAGVYSIIVQSNQTQLISKVILY